MVFNTWPPIRCPHSTWWLTAGPLGWFVEAFIHLSAPIFPCRHLFPLPLPNSRRCSTTCGPFNVRNGIESTSSPLSSQQRPHEEEYSLEPSRPGARRNGQGRRTHRQHPFPPGVFGCVWACPAISTTTCMKECSRTDTVCLRLSTLLVVLCGLRCCVQVKARFSQEPVVDALPERTPSYQEREKTQNASKKDACCAVCLKRSLAAGVPSTSTFSAPVLTPLSPLPPAPRRNRGSKIVVGDGT